jgi:hypothetical protein
LLYNGGELRTLMLHAVPKDASPQAQNDLVEV